MAAPPSKKKCVNNEAGGVNQLSTEAGPFHSYEYDRGFWFVGGGVRTGQPWGGVRIPMELFGRAEVQLVRGAWQLCVLGCGGS